MNLARIIVCLFLFCAGLNDAIIAQSASVRQPISTASATKTVNVKVKGVGCERDLQAISTNVAKVKGVAVCETVKKGATTTFSVTYNPAVATEEQIHAAVEETPGCSNQAARPYKVKL